MDILNKVISELQLNANPEKGKFLQGFFKTGPGQYGEGDIFLGISVPQQRKVANSFFKDISLIEVQKMLEDKRHEIRLTAVFMLVLKYQKSKAEEQKAEIAEFYIQNASKFNNWDLVDSSAGQILGAWLYDKDRGKLYAFAESENLWEQRISIISTFFFIRKGDFKDTLKIAENLLHHKHDLIHKAVGWMLREVGNRDFETEFEFLSKHYKVMPRTMLRYAIEKFDENIRQQFLKGII
jgi:3-methyladenine DNA glycosylase AlkD